MIRKQIYLEAEQDMLLKQLARETGQSESELIRQAIDQHIRTAHRPRGDHKAWEAEQLFVQQLIAQPASPAPRQWTRDELYDR